MVDRPLTSPIIDEKKSAALDFIFENALKSGFGTLSKTELDAILFAAIMEFGDKNSITDLELSKYLQITQRRVQSLKEKVCVKYKQLSKAEAIDLFIEQLKYAKLDDKYIDIPINNVGVRNELEGLLDENNILLHRQLNNKIFRVRIDDFMDVLLIIDNMSAVGKSNKISNEKIIETLKNQNNNLKNINIDLNSTDDDKKITKFKKILLNSSLEAGIEALAIIFPAGGLAIKALDILRKNIFND